MSLPPTDDERAVAAVNREVTRSQRAIACVAVVAGAVLIAATLRLPRGSGGFYAAGFALAAVWLAAAVAHGRIQWWGKETGHREQVAAGVVGGVVTFAVFLAAAAIGRHINLLAGPIDSVLGKADAGPVAAVLVLALVNGVAEELFFRGSLVDVSVARAPYIVSTAVYVAVTAVAGNTALTLAAAVMGTVFASERRVSRGLVASILTHLVWSTLIILLLPR